MNVYNWMGVVLFAGIYLATFLASGDAALLMNSVGLAVVISGTLGAVFLSYPVGDLIAALRVARNTYTQNMLTPERVIQILQELVITSRDKGVLALDDYRERTTILFLKRALQLLVDGFKEEEMHEMLHAEMFHFRHRRAQQERMFRHAARLAPAFGVAGSVIGLIAMLNGIEDPKVVLQTVPIALTSTLYGIVLANFMLTPVAESIHAKTQRELLLQKLITDGVVNIRNEPNPLRLATKLESVLTPSARVNDSGSIDELRQRIRDLHTEQEPGQELGQEAEQQPERAPEQ